MIIFNFGILLCHYVRLFLCNTFTCCMQNDISMMLFGLISTSKNTGVYYCKASSTYYKDKHTHLGNFDLEVRCVFLMLSTLTSLNIPINFSLVCFNYKPNTLFHIKLSIFGHLLVVFKDGNLRSNHVLDDHLIEV